MGRKIMTRQWKAKNSNKFVGVEKTNGTVNTDHKQTHFIYKGNVKGPSTKREKEKREVDRETNKEKIDQNKTSKQGFQ